MVDTPVNGNRILSIYGTRLSEINLFTCPSSPLSPLASVWSDSFNFNNSNNVPSSSAAAGINSLPTISALLKATGTFFANVAGTPSSCCFSIGIPALSYPLILSVCPLYISATFSEILPKSSTPLILLSANLSSRACNLFMKIFKSSRLSTTAVTALPIIAGIFLLKNNSFIEPVFPSAVSDNEE